MFSAGYSVLWKCFISLDFLLLQLISYNNMLFVSFSSQIIPNCIEIFPGFSAYFLPVKHSHL